jgi:hypothetical protein
VGDALGSSSACDAEGLGIGVGGAALEAVASGVAERKDCLSGEAAGFGVGFGEGVGLATISIFWRLFKKSSRSRFSSSVCCVTPWFEPSTKKNSTDKSGIFPSTRGLQIRWRVLFVSFNLNALFGI